MGRKWLETGHLGREAQPLQGCSACEGTGRVQFPMEQPPPPPKNN